MTRLEYNRYNFDSDSYYPDINLYLTMKMINLLVQTQITIYWQTINFSDMVKQSPLLKVFYFIITRCGDQRIQQLL